MSWIGVGSYVFGGGHGPYEGSLSVACDSLVAVKLVDRIGKIITANEKKNTDLFWALCRAGSAQFGIITLFLVRIVSYPVFDLLS